MDVVTDLTAEAVSYLTVIQDICKNNVAESYRKDPETALIWKVFEEIKSPSTESMKLVEIRIGELVWSSLGSSDMETKKKYFLAAARDLLLWLEPVIVNFEKWQSGPLTNISSPIPFEDNSSQIVSTAVHGFTQDSESPNIWVGPDFWRQRIVKILYQRV